MQTQTSNTLHNAIIQASSKDRPPMLAPGNYVQWKSRIKRYIDTKPNHELIHYCLENPPYKLGLVCYRHLSLEEGGCHAHHLVYGLRDVVISLLIKSGLVMPCINPEILMHSGSLLTCMLSALKCSMQASIDSLSLCLIWWISTGSLMYFFCCGKFLRNAFCRISLLSIDSGSSVPSYVLTFVGMRVLFGTLKLWIRVVNGSVSSHNHGWDRSSSLSAVCIVGFIPFSSNFSLAFTGTLNTVVLTWILRRAGFAPSRLSLASSFYHMTLTLKVGFLLAFVSFDASFHYRYLGQSSVACLLPLLDVFRTMELAGVWACSADLLIFGECLGNSLYRLASLLMAWVTMEALPYYPMGNRVVAVRSTLLTKSHYAEVNVLIVCYPYLGYSLPFDRARIHGLAVSGCGSWLASGADRGWYWAVPGSFQFLVLSLLVCCFGSDSGSG
nr:hypothetical protein [Tanacetum cinerariifolium]